jgi:hypothetical protein
VVRFYNQRGTAEQHIKEGKYAFRWTRLSCRKFRDNEVRLQLHALAYNLATFLLCIELPEAMADWSLTSLQLKLSKIDARAVRHARATTFQLAEVAVTGPMVGGILATIRRLRVPPSCDRKPLKPTPPRAAKPRMKRRCQLVRYADDFVMSFEDHLDGRRMLAVLGKRLGRYGLTLHPSKTRYVDFRFKRPNGRHPATQATSFAFLGFSHVWGTSRRGKPVVRQITAKDRYARALHAIKDWCQQHLHLSLRAQHRRLCRRMQGHYSYYGITGNGRRLTWYLHQVERIWKASLSQRSRSGKLTWLRMEQVLNRYPLPPTRIVHQWSRA